MRVLAFMSRSVESIRVTASPRAAREQMFRRRIRHLRVKRGGAPCGTLSDRDVALPADFEPASGGTLERLVTPLDVTVAPDATMRDVANVMRARGVDCLPVAGRTHRAVLRRRGSRGAPRSVR
jgi:CBS domain-containing protein